MQIGVFPFRRFPFCMVLLILASARGDGQLRPLPQEKPDTIMLSLADPTIFLHDKVYYLYGTGGNVDTGFLVYTSTDMKNWTGPLGATDGYALVEGHSFGTKGFWAPQVFYHNKKFYMAYTANENIAIAESESPLGPFRQKTSRPMSGAGKQIDPFVFFDKDGRTFLYHVRLTGGNKIFIARLKDDLSDIVAGSDKLCLEATASWENTAQADWPVTEGPTVFTHQGFYYLFYSANDFRNIDYAVGYATSKHPYGPWEKFPGNPVLSRHNLGRNGTGHGDFVTGEDSTLYYVLHTHASDARVQPRITGLVKGKFVAGPGKGEQVVFEEKSFHYLYSRDTRK